MSLSTTIQPALTTQEDDNLIAKQHNRSLAINRIMLASVVEDKVVLPTFSQMYLD